MDEEKVDKAKLVKLRLEQAENGWLCVTSMGKDEFAGRKVFTSTADLCDYLKRKYPDVAGPLGSHSK
jgi:hypothetical protein